jgi:hypothetical protein
MRAGMIRVLALSGIAAASLAWLPAHAQEIPELEGAPGTRAIEQPKPKPVVQKPVARPAPKKAQPVPAAMKAAQVKLAQQAEQQKAEQARLLKQAEDLRTKQAALDARAASLAAEEKRLAQLHADQQAQLAVKQAELTKQQAEAVRASQAADEKRRVQLADQQAQLAARQAELTKQQAEAARNAAQPPERQAPATEARNPDPPRIIEPAPQRDPPELYRAASPRIVFAAARRACISAAEEEAANRDFDTATYDGEPRLYQRGGWQLRGRMRLGDGRGYLLVDTVCEVDDSGEVQRFSLLR